MELLKGRDLRVEQLVSYLRELVAGNVSKESYDRYAPVLESATPFEVNEALSEVLEPAVSVSEFLSPVSRFIRAAGKSLDRQVLTEYPEGHLLARLTEENGKIRAGAANLQTLSKSVSRKQADRKRLVEAVASFSLPDSHYTALQNELFPLFEAASADHACVKLMWEIEDMVKESRLQIARSGNVLPEPDFWRLYGRFYSNMQILLYREERILFPVAYRAVSPDAFAGKRPEAGSSLGRFACATGSLSFDQLETIFSLLPLDIAFIDASDRVAFYTDPPHRIFPRTPAVIGRLVQNCHPPKSVDAVNRILTSFKDGTADTAEFYLTIGGKFVHIEYFAVRNKQGTYQGTLEVTQDATHLRSLTGEKRL